MNIVSLFSGCGGLDLGFKGNFDFLHRHYYRHDTHIVFANDFDPDAVNCYNSNPLLVGDGEVPNKLGDIRDISVDEIPNFDILLAGFPCQPFSNAGNRKGIKDNNGRGTLFYQCERILRGKIEIGQKPLAFVFENVRGILSSKMDDGITTVPDEIRKRMEFLHYKLSMQLVRSSNYGVPQNRYRVLIIGVDDRFPIFDFNEMRESVEHNHLQSVQFGNYEELLLGYILQHCEDAPTGNEYWPYSATTQNMIEKIGPCRHGINAIKHFHDGYRIADLPEIDSKGRSWKDIPPEQLTPRFRKIHDNPKRYHAPKFFRRFAFGEINGTITASAQPENCGITHPVENRRFSVREIARIQSFPDDYNFEAIPLQSRYKVIGNAVPPVMAWVIADSLIRHLKKNIHFLNK
jgi:DNA (cytosine-5)-methyltransferase 1